MRGKFAKIKEVIIEFAIQNKMELFIITILTGVVYFVLMQIGIATHDELAAIANAKTKGLQLRFESRWGMSIFTIPIYFQSISSCYIVYRIYTLAGLIIACGGIVGVIYHHIDKKFAWAFPILFFLFATMDLNHNGLYAFGWKYQFCIGLFFISLDLFLFYLKKEKKSYWIFSGIFYFLSIAAYECFVPCGIIFFCVSCYYRYEHGSLSLKNLINDLKLNTFLAIFYTVSFFAVVKFIFNGYGGDAEITGGVDFLERIRSSWDYSLGLFPLKVHYSNKNIHILFSKMFDLTSENMMQWVIIFFFSVFFTCFIVRVKRKITFTFYFFISIICLLGMIIPNAVLVLNSKFVMWNNDGIQSFGTSYYSYFFIIVWIESSLILLNQKIKYKTFNKCFILVLVVTISELVMIGNQGAIEVLAGQEDRYEAFWEFLQTDEYAKTKKDAIVYTENLQGIHNDIKINGDYADRIADTDTVWINDREDIDFSCPVYMLKYDSNVKAIYYAEIDSNWNTDRIYVYQHEPDIFGVKVRRTFGDGIEKMLINGNMHGYYEINAITGVINEKVYEVSVECKDMDVRTFSIVRGAYGLDTRIVNWFGFYEVESWGRWVEKESTVEINNIYNIDKCTLEFNLLAHDIGKIQISNGLHRSVIDVDTQYQDYKIEIPLEKGVNFIKFDSDTADLDVELDVRNINWGTTYFDIIYGGHVISCVK